ncbi:hypothetical protein SEENIN0B_02119 [Salmonella enterica subsp. enterica serovar Infantis str. SARB27]|uniref:Uncharacterized protein n=1 Tax=Salmonella enterica subsp. enterica serovar Infantis str. SARB27 TaxID=596155 RepID=A0A6C8G891_SALIN|nr:hypothetical protein SEENIN0B_02119 [Salmonella enterica subsp. enterica serovar Infantis str. SARB27]
MINKILDGTTMQLPEQDEFFDFLAANDDEQASLRRKFFLVET